MSVDLQRGYWYVLEKEKEKSITEKADVWPKLRRIWTRIFSELENAARFFTSARPVFGSAWQVVIFIPFQLVGSWMFMVYAASWYLRASLISISCQAYVPSPGSLANELAEKNTVMAHMKAGVNANKQLHNNSTRSVERKRCWVSWSGGCWTEGKEVDLFGSQVCQRLAIQHTQRSYVSEDLN